jgi:MFS-type transporter involved in bile tolerance (Atg22 family)
MERQTQRVRMAWWHSLMYATGTLLIVCGIPASVVLVFIFGREFHLDRSEMLRFGGCIVGIELVLGVVLSFIAERITKQQRMIEK